MADKKGAERPSNRTPLYSSATNGIEAFSKAFEVFLESLEPLACEDISEDISEGDGTPLPEMINLMPATLQLTLMKSIASSLALIAEELCVIAGEPLELEKADKCSCAYCERNRNSRK